MPDQNNLRTCKAGKGIIESQNERRQEGKNHKTLIELAAFRLSGCQCSFDLLFGSFDVKFHTVVTVDWIECC